MVLMPTATGWGRTGSQVNTWNVENQLISNGTVDPSGDLLTYTYDPWGKRVLQYGAGASGVPDGWHGVLL